MCESENMNGTLALCPSDFEKVCEFNKSFDFPVHSDMTDKKCMKLRLDLIREELDELKTAFDKDFIEEQDACADILYVAYGMAYTYGWNSDYIMDSKYVSIQNGTTLYTKIIYGSNTREEILSKLFESFDKLEKSAYDNNIEHVIEYLHIIIYNVYYFQYVSEYDSDRIFKIVHDSNMSKLCKNEEEAVMTVNDYKEKFEKGTSPYDSPYFYKLDNGLFVVKNKSTGKALKSINYIKVQL